MRHALLCAVAAVTLLAGCSYNSEYVWVDELDEAALAASMYQIQPGDRLAISVWNQEHLSGEARVREDGHATLPLLGDVRVAGTTATDAASAIQKRLRGMVLDPKVTVAVVESRPPTVTVLGEVRAPGNVALVSGDRVLDALAKAGGVTEFASDDLYVIRDGDRTVRVRFDYGRLVHADGRGVTFRLRPGDIVVVD